MIHNHAPQLVADLVPLILDSTASSWPRDFCRLGLISSIWLDPVRRRLYDHPILHSFKGCSLLARTLESNPSLLSLLHGLDLRPMYDERSQERQSLAKDLTGVRYLLNVDGLRTITLGGQLSLAAERFLMMMGSAYTVEELCVDGGAFQNSLSRRPSLEWGGSVGCMLPSLKKLVLKGIELDVVQPISCQLRLTELVLDHVTLTGGFLVHMLDEDSTLGRLTIVTDDSVAYDEQIRSLTHYFRIEGLEYDGDECGGSPIGEGGIVGSDSANLRSLRELHLRGFNVDWDALEMIGEQCPELEELVVAGEGVRLSAEEWATFIERASGCLKRVGCPEGDSGERVSSMCRTYGVVLLGLY
ncbi:hypothetical protein BDN72DRAFT_16959 [Pluteus cervinus]|uniref:Uncharacterized protein n=1 Tax=Pluteus cervinus TaxID=181527 RepID=A0ACD3BGX8_9AGAR|nr:hypothetical protein BDN72DRAFT_16959 [Pluteus cervinus]